MYVGVWQDHVSKLNGDWLLKQVVLYDITP